jgi:hypothetical protein
LFLSSGNPRWMPLELMRATFVAFLKGNWFLGILLSHKLLSLDICPVSGFLMGVSRWLPMDGFSALGSALQAIKQMCSYLSLVHVLIKGTSWCWYCAWKPHSLSNDQAKSGCITSTCNRAEQAFPLSNLGAQVFPWSLPPPQIFCLLSRLRTPLGIPGGGVG